MENVNELSASQPIKGVHLAMSCPTTQECNLLTKSLKNFGKWGLKVAALTFQMSIVPYLYYYNKL